jgi:D-ribose pyranase
MKKTALINAPLSSVLARMGHGDLLIVADCGLPIPHPKPLVDLAVSPNLPPLLDVLAVILEELKVEKVIITNEMEHRSPNYRANLEKLMKEKIPNVPVEKISHEELKSISKQSENVSFVRTGEATPFANLILVAGVVF